MSTCPSTANKHAGAIADIRKTANLCIAFFPLFETSFHANLHPRTPAVPAPRLGLSQWMALTLLLRVCASVVDGQILIDQATVTAADTFIRYRPPLFVEMRNFPHRPMS